ncbi:MAG: tripartite tricarboxylate transporter TctB family protein [Burkholderiales bacterium]|nr:MAG: tripartite tricarboxylate transporter TctB family protein [Burkholderiales bacterium]
MHDGRDIEVHRASELLDAPHHPAEVLFAAVTLLAAMLLLSQLGEQTRFVRGAPLVSQPGFWPGLSLAGMVLFGALELLFSWIRNRRQRLGAPEHAAAVAPARHRIVDELAVWGRALEYLAWFMAYVALVPVAGYLPTTVLFCVLLAWRLGYRSRGMLAAAVLTAMLTVVTFKALLQVKIPGAVAYEWLPSSVRNFMILYL